MNGAFPCAGLWQTCLEVGEVTRQFGDAGQVAIKTTGLGAGHFAECMRIARMKFLDQWLYLIRLYQQTLSEPMNRFVEGAVGDAIRFGAEFFRHVPPSHRAG